MRKIDGTLCAFCFDPISDADKGRLCEGCQNPVHLSCMRTEHASTGRQTCDVCGINLDLVRRGQPQAGSTLTRWSVGGVLKKTFGIVFLVLAALAFLSAVLQIGSAPNVSYLVGTFLPSVVFAIIGLLLIR